MLHFLTKQGNDYVIALIDEISKELDEIEKDNKDKNLTDEKSKLSEIKTSIEGL